jgi:CubicO group peptidase (beta-lactamase class C family)
LLNIQRHDSLRLIGPTAIFTRKNTKEPTMQRELLHSFSDTAVRQFQYAFAVILIGVSTLASGIASAQVNDQAKQVTESAASSPKPKRELNLDGDFADNIDRHLQALASRGMLSGSVLVARGDKIALSKGYGFASVELQVPNTPNTAFRIASITKQFTAVAVLMLTDRKRLSLTDPISKHISNLPDAWKKVTVRQLLDHTSGIPSYTDFVDLRSFALTKQTPQSMMALSAAHPMNFEPGAGQSYNNTAYIIAGLLIERVSGKSYADFIEQELLAPFGMKDSGYAFNDRVIPGRAQTYTEDGGKVTNAQYLDMSVPYSAGAMYATTLDLHRWHQQLYGGKILKPASLEAMVDGGKHRYGLGIGVRGSEYGVVYSHTGGMPGVRTVLIYEPATQLTVAVLGNLDTASIEDIAWLIRNYARDRSQKLAQQYTVTDANAAGTEATSSEAAAILGRYGVVANKDEPAREVQVRKLDGFTQFVPAGSGPLRLLRVGPFRYVNLSVMEEFNFTRDSSGNVNGIETRFDDKPITLKRLPPLKFGTLTIYLRGTMNSWGTTKKMTAANQANVYSARVTLATGAHGFKLATEDWRTIDFGAPSQHRDDVLVGKSFALATRGTNLRLWIDDAGEYEFVLDASNADSPTVMVRAVQK